MERMEDMLDRQDDDNDRPRRYHVRPTFYGNEPFDHFSVRVRMEHPYWTGIHRGAIAAPTFSSEYPSIEEFAAKKKQLLGI